MSDVNAKFGNGLKTVFVGPLELGENNEGDDQLEMFAEENQFVVLNTFFPLPPRRLYTWISSTDKPEQIIYN